MSSQARTDIAWQRLCGKLAGMQLQNLFFTSESASTKTSHLYMVSNIYQGTKTATQANTNFPSNMTCCFNTTSYEVYAIDSSRKIEITL